MGNLFRSERLRLAALTTEDADTFARWSRDAEYLRFFDTEYAMPRSADYYRADIQAEAANPNAMEFGIRLAEDDRLIGYISINHIEWNNRSGRLSIGIGEADCRHLGYGTEAIGMLLRYAFDELNLNRVGLDVIAHNRAAIRSYEKSGFAVEGRIREGVLRDGKKIDRIYMGILRSEWEDRRGERHR